MRSLYSYLREVKDHRRLQGQRTPMAAFMEMIVLAALGRQTGIREISRFIKNNDKFFVERYGLKHGTPTYATLRNFLGQLNHKSFLNAVRSWVLQYTEDDDLVAIDVKAHDSTMTLGDIWDNSKQILKSMLNKVCDEKEIEALKSFENKSITAEELIKACESKGITFAIKETG